jgi:hypothetical protein
LYNKRMSRATPGLMVFLIDCSASMSFPMVRDSTDPNTWTKFQAASTILDNFLYQCTIKCASEDKYKDYLDFVILGYGDNTFSPISKISTSEYPISVNKLDSSYESVEEFSEEELDETNSPLKWINSDSVGGNTAMLNAFTKVKKIIEDWVKKHPDSYPPVLLNISDGMANDLPRDEEDNEKLDPSPLFELCNDIKKIQTNDGNTVIGNIHLSDVVGAYAKFPVSIDEVLDIEDPAAVTLFEMSSTVPVPWLEKAQGFGFDIRPGGKFYIYNSDFDSFLSFFKFGTDPTNG